MVLSQSLIKEMELDLFRAGFESHHPQSHCHAVTVGNNVAWREEAHVNLGERLSRNELREFSSKLGKVSGCAVVLVRSHELLKMASVLLRRVRRHMIFYLGDGRPREAHLLHSNRPVLWVRQENQVLSQFSEKIFAQINNWETPMPDDVDAHILPH